MAETNAWQVRRFWLVTDGTAARQGWAERLKAALRSAGVELEVLSLPSMLAATARGVLETGADAVARALRLKSSMVDSQTRELYDRHRPELILVDHPGAGRWLELLRQAVGSGALHVGVLSAWEPSEGWSECAVDALVASDELQLVPMRHAGLESDAALVAPAVAPAAFVQPVQAATRAQAGLSERAPLVLMDLSAASVAQIQGIFAALAGRPLPQLMVYTGENTPVADACRMWAGQFRVPAQLFSAQTPAAPWSALADLVVLTPGAVNLAGYLWQGRPVVSLHATVDPTLPVRSGAVVAVADSAALAHVVSWLVGAPLPDAHRQAAAAWAGTDGLEILRHRLFDLAARREPLRARQRATPAAPPSAGGSAGPFETIGAGSGTGPGAIPAGPVVVAPDAPMARNEARDQLASLIVQEKRIEASLDQLTGQRDQWLQRLDLAAGAGDTALVAAAQAQVDQLTAQIANLGEQLSALERQKDQVRRRAAMQHAAGRQQATTSELADVEARFRDLERQRALESLRAQATPDAPES
jgi:flagellar biosynthesis chaperone FliJ